VVFRYRISLEQKQYAPSTISLCLAVACSDRLTRRAGSGKTGWHRRFSGKSSEMPRHVQALRSSHRTTSVALAPVYAISHAANWIKSNFCLGTPRYRRLSGTSAVSRSCACREWQARHRTQWSSL